jgi:hypothetical protein
MQTRVNGLATSDSLVGEVKASLTGLCADVEHDRSLATVVFTDIVGSTERAVDL